MVDSRTNYRTLERVSVQKDWSAIKLRYEAESRALDLARYRERTGRAPISGDRRLVDAHIALIEV